MNFVMRELKSLWQRIVSAFRVDRIMSVTINVYECGEKQRLRIVPRLGPIQEQPSGAVLPKNGTCRIRGQTIMGFALTATQQVDLSVTVTDRKGNPAQVQDPTFMSNNESILTVVPDAGGDPLKCSVVATGALGSASITFSADADLGSGVEPLLGTFDVDVGPGKATVVTLNPGTPTEQP